MSRGPYKRYEHDPSISVPKTTNYYRRKRQIEEVEQETLITATGCDHAQQHEDNELTQSFVEENTNDENQVGDVRGTNTDDFDTQVFIDPTFERTENIVENDNTEEDKHDGDEYIYSGSDVTKAQSLLLVLSYMLRHRLTDVALKDLLMLLNTFFPSTFPTTKYKFYKSLKMENSEIHYYCALCYCYMGKDQSARPCESCQMPFCGLKCMEKGSYFLYIPVKQQVKAILSDPKLYKLLTNRDLESLSLMSTDTVNDITTSCLYKELISRTCFTGNDVSLTWNTDGIPVFNSSKFAIWPLQASLNELPPHLRTKNMLLMGLWFGGKPVMNTFLKPFVDECSQLQQDGFLFSNELQPRKVFPLIFCGDAPARAIVKNSKQYNGCYGCDWCESPGVPVVVNNGPPTRYYPYRTPVVMRTARNQALYAMQATPEGPIKGVKGVTVVDLLPTFDTVRGTATDYMHSVCQGVTRQMVRLWVDSKNHAEEFYIGQNVDLVNKRLLSISPPSEIHRAPRSLSERSYWKASEWRAFLFYSLIILQGILPTRYLNHFFLYVYGIYTLLGDSISTSSITLSEACLTKFVIEMEVLYGISSCTFNVHCLTHLAHCVKDCGPLWATSALNFEAHNHVLLNMFSGTQYVPSR